MVRRTQPSSKWWGGAGGLSILCVLGVWGCTSDTNKPGDVGTCLPDSDVADLCPGAGLTDLGSSCTYTASTKNAAIVLTTATTDDFLMLTRDNASRLLINMIAGCGGTTIYTSGSTNQVTNIDITGTADSETYLIDYINGTFSLGTTAGAGIDIAMSTGTDKLKIRGYTGTAAGDQMHWGTDASTNPTMMVGAINPTASAAATSTTAADAYADIVLSGYTDLKDTVTVTLGQGNDTFNANWASGTQTFGSGAAAVTLSAATTSSLVVYGGEGNDRLVGAPGTSTLYGGDGNDSFVSSGGDDGDDTYDCGSGTDTLNFSGRTAGVAIALATYSSGWTTAASVDLDGGGAGTETDTFVFSGTSACEIAVGGTGNDVFFGGSGNETFYGGSGNDTFIGGPGADVMNGDAGDDHFLMGLAYTGTGSQYDDGGGDILNGGSGTDTANYGYRIAALTITVGTTTADDGASGENDNVKSDIERVYGGIAGDTITGGTGNDFISGCLLPSTCQTGGTGGSCAVYCAQATAIYNLTNYLSTLSNHGYDAAIDSTGSGALNEHAGVNSVGNYFANDDDTLNGGAGNDTLFGQAGNDTYNGGSGDDVFWMGPAGSTSGNASWSFDGDDVLNGGAGVDTADYGLRPFGTTLANDNDVYITVGDGVANDGDIACDADTAEETSDEDDEVKEDVEYVYTGTGADSITDAYTYSGTGAFTGIVNFFRGGQGADFLNGGSGDDLLDGQAGNDTLICGDGTSDVNGDDLGTQSVPASDCEL